jgi:hypothetical protein
LSQATARPLRRPSWVKLRAHTHQRACAFGGAGSTGMSEKEPKKSKKRGGDKHRKKKVPKVNVDKKKLREALDDLSSCVAPYASAAWNQNQGLICALCWRGAGALSSTRRRMIWRGVAASCSWWKPRGGSMKTTSETRTRTRCPPTSCTPSRMHVRPHCVAALPPFGRQSGAGHKACGVCSRQCVRG